jgi:hypothetical protein
VLNGVHHDLEKAFSVLEVILETNLTCPECKVVHAEIMLADD